jgi:hypothetical protein
MTDEHGSTDAVAHEMSRAADDLLDELDRIL